MKKNRSNDLVLGVMVTERTVHAVLMRSTPRGAKLLRRYTRQRTAAGGVPQTPGADAPLPGLEESGDDFSFDFSDDGGMGSDMFLGSEFGDLGEIDGLGGGEAGGDVPSTFALELADILSEAKNHGYDEFEIAFCVGSNEIERAEVMLEEKMSSSDVESGSDLHRPSRGKLLSALEEQHDGTFDRDRVGFLPMTPGENGRARFIALIPGPVEPVTSTVRTMRDEKRSTLPGVHFLDSEVSIYAGLARVAQRKQSQPTDGRSTLIVRASTEDTLVLFLRDGQLHHCESLRSLTAFDAPETICSRVLLLQDEYGIGEVDHVMLLSDEGEGELIESFQMFFPDARVDAMRRLLPETEKIDYEEEKVSIAAAVGAALRVAGDERYASAFEKVNMLPKSLLRRRVSMPIAWPSIAALAVLFLTVMFFMWRFLSMEGEINEAEAKLQRYRTTEVTEDPQVLQARIDSMEHRAERVLAALDVLDELLVGSDRWSRSLAKASRNVSEVGGIWVESWSPRGEQLRVSGNATSRDHVVSLADRLGGTIESLTFSEIREWPVYSFDLNVPVPNELPKAAQYLRARVAASDSLQTGSVARPASMNQ